MIILAKLHLILLIIVTAHVHVVLRFTRILWLTLIVLFPLTAFYEPRASKNCSLLVLSHSYTSTGDEYILLCVILCSSCLLASVSSGPSLTTQTIANSIGSSVAVSETYSIVCTGVWLLYK